MLRVRDPLEGLSESGTIRTGADMSQRGRGVPARSPSGLGDDPRARPSRVGLRLRIRRHGSGDSRGVRRRPAHDRATAKRREPDWSRTLDTVRRRLSGRRDRCRRRPATSSASSDESYGNRVFLRHYCVLLAGSDAHRPKHDFAGDRRAARGFNGDIAQHVQRWRTLSRQTRTQDPSRSGWHASHCWRLPDWSASMTTPGPRTERRAHTAGAKSSQHVTMGSTS